MSQAATADHQVLEFDLGPDRYCVDIGYVEEIVDRGDLTDVPNAPPHVVGVMDLRGRTTTIVDPAVVFDLDDVGDQDRIVVFDPEALEAGEAIGWMVDAVNRVEGIDEEDIEEPAVAEGDAVRGVIRDDEGFVIFVNPDRAGSSAER